MCKALKLAFGSAPPSPPRVKAVAVPKAEMGCSENRTGAPVAFFLLEGVACFSAVAPLYLQGP